MARGAAGAREMALMRWIWTDEGSSWPDYAKGDKQGINGYFVSIREATKPMLEDIANHGYVCGVYMATNWDEFRNLNGPETAEKMHELVKPLSWSAARPKVQFDIEQQDPAKILACFARWRQLQPKRDTSWTMEGHQGGWMSRVFVDALVGYRIRFVPQCYSADMKDQWDTLAMARDLTRRGVPDSLVSPFIDAAELPNPFWWEGFAFTQNRLPA